MPKTVNVCRKNSFIHAMLRRQYAMKEFTALTYLKMHLKKDGTNIETHLSTKIFHQALSKCDWNLKINGTTPIVSLEILTLQKWQQNLKVLF